MTTTASSKTETNPGNTHEPARISIGLLGEAASSAWQPLFAALARLFPVEFQNGVRQNGNCRSWTAAIVFSQRYEDGLALAPDGLPVFLALESATSNVRSAGLDISFSASAGLDSSLQGQVMEDRDLQTFFPITPIDGDEVVASRNEHPLWIRRSSPSGKVDVVAVHPPVLGPGNYLCEDFTAGRFMRLLPLIAFLKRLTAAVDWQDSGKQACFVFDDPSLYWTSYGYLDFRRLAGHARTHNYYAAVATIALDTWWINPGTLAIFRENAPRLSLLLHGNSHLKNELAETGSSAGSVEILAQALRRLARLERHQGLEVCRVMEAPGAAIAEATLRGMSQLDFEGVLATPELLLRFNRQTVWPATLGLERSNLPAGGLPIIPRIKMTRDWKTNVRLAAFLDQPVVLAGHHEDAAGGLELLAEFARTVNGIGGFTWASPRGILRSSYKQLRDGTSLHVRMYSRRISFTVPEGVQTVWIHRPWIAKGSTDEILTLRCSGKQDGLSDLYCPVAGPITVQPSETLEIASLLKNPVDYRITPAPSMRLWPLVRKVLMEFRDRTRPLLPRKPDPGAGFAPFEKPAVEAAPSVPPGHD